jgi:hypothetical protein
MAGLYASRTGPRAWIAVKRRAGFEKPKRQASLSLAGMDNTIESLTLEVADSAASQDFYQAAFDLDTQVHARVADTRSSGFRGFTISLVVSQPSTVDSLLETATPEPNP